jgi:hypothetical protein
VEDIDDHLLALEQAVGDELAGADRHGAVGVLFVGGRRGASISSALLTPGNANEPLLVVRAGVKVPSLVHPHRDDPDDLHRSSNGSALARFVLNNTARAMLHASERPATQLAPPRLAEQGLPDEVAPVLARSSPCAVRSNSQHSFHLCTRL